jgi:serine protease Do
MKKKFILFFAFLAFFVPAFGAVQYIPASFKDLADKVRPSVVNISTVSTVRVSQDPLGDPFFNDDFYQKFFGVPKQQMKRQSLGSGFIVSPDGYILTNNHVVDKADEITVKLYNQKEYKAKVTGVDKETDLAVIKIDAAGLAPISMGDSDKMDVGDWVLAVGSPFGLEQTVTQGIISAKGRIIGAGPYDDFLQTDAAINPGNSGGPLINMDGEVIGINTAISSTSGGYEGVGFAMPINIAKKSYSDIINKGKVIRGWLGVVIQEMTPELEKHFKVSGGVLVSQVYDGSPAAEGGIKRGDVVVEIGGKKIQKYRELQSIIAAESVGALVPIKVVRDGKEITLNIKVAERNMQQFAGEQQKKYAGEAKKDLGIATEDITPEAAARYGITAKQGVVVLQVEENSSADGAGVMAGDVIHEMNGKQIKSREDFDRAAAQVKKDAQVVLLIERGNTMVYMAFTNN